MKIEELITRGVKEIIEKESILKKLNSGRKLVVKLGIDPTSPDLHIGHYLVLRKLQDFQELGHEAVLVIGDFTALIGDPSGRDKKRVALTKDQIEENLKYYKRQAGKIINLDKVKIVHNSEWLGKMGVEGILELSSKATYSQIMERDEFKNRLRKDDLSMMEFLYPLLQAYDSVVLKADVEIGGLDQKLNLLMGRQIQKRYGLEEQDLVLTPLLIGLDGKEKMSKSANNYVAINDQPKDMFGKVMGISDGLTKDYLFYCTRIEEDDIKKIFSEAPLDAKKRLAFEIVKIYHGEGEAQEAQNEFERVIQKGELPSQVEVIEKSRSEIPISYASLVTDIKAASSVSEAIRLAEQKGLRFDGEIIENARESFNTAKEETLIQIGKRKALRIIWKDN